MNTKEINVKTEEMLDKYYIVGLENGRGPSKAFRKKKKNVALLATYSQPCESLTGTAYLQI